MRRSRQQRVKDVSVKRGASDLANAACLADVLAIDKEEPAEASLRYRFVEFPPGNLSQVRYLLARDQQMD